MGAAEEYARAWAARRDSREPERVREVGDRLRKLPVEEGYRPLNLSGVLPMEHPLADTPAELRAKRLTLEKQRRGLQ